MKTIKDFINESYKGNTDNYSNDELTLINKLKPLIGSKMQIELKLDDISIERNFKIQAIERSVGHIIESYIGTVLGAYSTYNEEDKSYDCYLNINDTRFNIEIKAYKDGKKDNITFTKSQMTSLKDKNITFIYVDYEFSSKFWEVSLTINDILVGKYEDVQNDKGSITRHGGKTSNMVSLLQDLDKDAKDLINRLSNKKYKMTSTDKKLWTLKLANKFISWNKIALNNPGSIIKFIQTDPCWYQGGYGEVYSQLTPFNEKLILDLFDVNNYYDFAVVFGYTSNKEYDPNQAFIVQAKEKVIIVPDENIINRLKLNMKSNKYKVIIDKDKIGKGRPDADYFAVYGTISE